jgi:sterol desaturase/sphingolipid hydroxylase (fatty acid hydroxylase superfamily)
VGWSAWSLAEYALHRWAMHGPLRHQPLATEHRAHHRAPSATDPCLRALTYLPAAAGGMALGSVAGRLVGRPAGLATATAFTLGYACYEQLHWRAHHRRPVGPIERRIRLRHATHHAHPGANYGVTTRIWDRLFATAA